MRTLKVLLPAVLAVATVTVSLPEIADAAPKSFNGRANRFTNSRSRGVPELSVGAAGAALALLGGGMMVMVGRRRKRG